MIVIAVKSLDVDACFGHQSSDLAKLAGHRLTQTLHEHLAFGEHANAGGLERAASSCAIMEEEVRNSFTVDHKSAAALDADASAAQRFSHLGQRSRAIRASASHLRWSNEE